MDPVAYSSLFIEGFCGALKRAGVTDPDQMKFYLAQAHRLQLAAGNHQQYEAGYKQAATGIEKQGAGWVRPALGIGAGLMALLYGPKAKQFMGTSPHSPWAGTPAQWGPLAEQREYEAATRQGQTDEPTQQWMRQNYRRQYVAQAPWRALQQKRDAMELARQRKQLEFEKLTEEQRYAVTTANRQREQTRYMQEQQERFENMAKLQGLRAKYNTPASAGQAAPAPAPMPAPAPAPMPASTPAPMPAPAPAPAPASAPRVSNVAQRGVFLHNRPWTRGMSLA